MSYPIEKIEGIGPAYAAKLTAAGVKTTADLLSRAGSPKGREELASATGIAGKLILRWANISDLMRIKGVGEEYSELLEAAGVDTVKELRTRNADNLTAAMAKVNEEKKLVRVIPSLAAVTQWIAQAKELPPMMTY